MTAPAHALASVTTDKTAYVDVALDRLQTQTRETAQYLIEGDFKSAAKSAYRAAWYWQKLPESEQTRYVECEDAEDSGPTDDGSEWSAAAFAVWLVYRCNRIATAYGRDLSAVGERYEREGTRSHLLEDRAAALPHLTQADMFGDAVSTLVRKERLQS